MDTKKIQEAVKMIIDAVGEDGSREGLQETPERIAKMYQEIFAGLNQTAEATYQNLLRLWTTIWWWKRISSSTRCVNTISCPSMARSTLPISQMGA